MINRKRIKLEFANKIRNGGITVNKYSMNYDKNQEQWFVELQERAYALHCGENFQLLIGQKAVPCQLELAEKWYVIMNNTSFDLRENEQYMIHL